MAGPQEISDDEIILRRIPPDPRCVVGNEAGSVRASSFALRPKPDEKGPSFTRLKFTSPKELLNQLALQQIPSADWRVCKILVSDVRALGLEVVYSPTDIDAGHCEIRPGKQKFTDAIWSKLAKKSRVLSVEEIEKGMTV